MLLGLGASWLLARRARAALTEQTSAIGRRLGAFGELGGSTTELTLNGQRFAFSARTFELPHTELVERFVTACDDHTKPLAEALAEGLPRVRAEAPPLLRSLLAPHAFADDGTASAVCLVGLANEGVRGLAARARAFVHTRDLGALGQLRFAFVRSLAPRRAQLLLVTADRGLALDALLPRGDTDVPGGDVLPVRPDGGVRTLSAEVHGTPHGISVYRVADGPRAALRRYDGRLTALGCSRVVALTQARRRGRARSGVRPCGVDPMPT